jgi:hypothetical protein
LVEVCPWNLITYSEEFNNGSKALVNATIGVDVTTAPNGTTTADSLIENGANDLHAVYNFSALTYVAGVYSLSCYVKKGARDWVRVQLYDGTNTPSAWANVNTGVLGTITGGATASIENVGNGWYRINISSAMISASGGWAIYSSTADAQYAGYQGTNGTTALYLWGIQINNGALKPYFPTTDRLNVPRLTYQNGGGGCPSLLLEKQSTNYFPYSQSVADWYEPDDGVTLTSNTTDTLSPDGTYNASKIAIVGGNQRSYQITNSVSGVGTFSAYVKAGTSNTITLYTSSASVLIGYNLSTLAVTQTAGTGTITSVGNGWFRITATNTLGAGEVLQVLYTGTANQTIYVWGFQVEASSYATSYIPTTSASATRVADACFKTGATSLIGQTEGTMFGEIEVILGTTNMLGWMRKLSGGLYGDGILAYVSSTGLPNAGVDVGGVNQVAIAGTTALTAGYHKIAFAYKANDFVLYVNGAQVASSTSGTVPTCDELYIDNYIDGGARNATKKEFVLFKTRLTNAELAQLTA